MKVFAAGIAAETNTFSPIPTGLEDFWIIRKSDIDPDNPDYGMFNLFEDWRQRTLGIGGEFHFSLMAWAQPAGLTSRAGYESLKNNILSDLSACLPVDIVLLNLHGAMVAHGYPDCEQDLIKSIRSLVGKQAVIGVELDLHCHLSEAKISDADIVVTYKEYPHTDINDRAIEAFDLSLATFRGEIVPRMALFDCQMMGLFGTSASPMRDIVASMQQMESLPGVLSASFGHGFPWGDVAHGGSKTLVITNDDPDLAFDQAQSLGNMIYAHRREIGFDSLDIDTALTSAIESKVFPVVVADQSDNAGGGAPADSTFALRWLIDNNVKNAAVAIMYDPQAVQFAHAAGVGETLPLRLGGKTSEASGDPIDLVVTVRGIKSNYEHDFPQTSGDPVMFPLGDVAHLQAGGIDIIVCSIRCQCLSPTIFCDFGIDPKSKDILIVKSMQHFHGAFEPIAAKVIYMAAPGAVPPKMQSIQYENVDTHRLFPWHPDPKGTGAGN